MPKKLDKEEFQEAELVDEVWSKKRIFLGLIILGVVLIGGWFVFKNSVIDILSKQATLGTQDAIEPVNLPTKGEVDKILTNARESLSEITTDNVTSSQSAIQKIIADLEKLQGEEVSTAAIICSLLCKE